jgi:hypothetical protein
MLEGGCECGQVRYRLTSAPIFVNCCHCRQCQKLGGSAFAINAMIEAAHVEITAGPEENGEDGAARCRACGTLLWGLHPMFGETIRFVRVGTLDEGEKLPPDAHFFVRSKHPWIAVPAGMPSFETLPGPDDPPLFGPEAQARLKAATG